MGLGFDSHSFGVEGTLVLGGVSFPGIPALRGHSDGDALLHAIIDALLGGAAAGDIGEFFPDTSHKWKGASSSKMLARTLAAPRVKNSQIEHLDITIVTDKPKLKATKMKIRQNVAKILKVPLSHVNLKAKRQEGLNWFKAPGGIAVWALATLIKKGVKK